MPQNLKQFNFKLPESLLKQLDKLAEIKGVTKTELVIQGICQVLGIPSEKPQPSSVDSGIYQQLDKLEQSFQESVDYQSGIDLETNRRIKALEETVEKLKSRLSAIDIASSIAASLDENRIPDEAIAEPQTDSSLQQGLGSGIANDIYVELGLKAFETDTAKPAQLELAIETSDEASANSHQTVDSIEMLNILKTEDPQRGWTNEVLTTYRRNKGLKDKWHTAGGYQFKYSGESKKEANSRKIVHLWLVNHLSKS